MFSKALWAKRETKDSGYYWLPLYQHLVDTKDVIGLLYEHWLSDGQRNILDDSLDEKSKGKAKELAVFLGAVHDIAKATPAFQTKKLNFFDEDILNVLIEKLENDDFKNLLNFKAASAKYSHHTVAGEYILSILGINEDINCIIGSHHGKPVDYSKTYKDQASYEDNLYQIPLNSIDNELKKKIHNRWKNEQKEILYWALKISGFNEVSNLPKINQIGQVIYTGLLIMADWIASNETYFPLIPIEQSEVKDKEKRKETGFLSWRKSYNCILENTLDYKEKYKIRFGFTPRSVQAKLSKIINETEEPGIFILEAPMGVGKTEAALIGSEQLAEKTGRSGIFFGLPTQATSDGIFPRILSWLNSIKNESKENLQIRLVHSKAALNDDFMSLASNVDLDSPDGNIIVNQWFSGKNTSSIDDFVVGTVDYFLMVALKQKHLFLRHLGFSKKVVIIDEVHAYDAYMSQYLIEAIEWMGAYKVPMIILSATLPEEKRIQMIKSYLKGKGADIKGDTFEQLKQTLSTLSYPLITYTDGKAVRQERDFIETNETSKQINILHLDTSRLIDKVKELTFDGGIVGIIVNTVKKAQDLTRLLEKELGEENVELLHSNFISTDRIKNEKNLLSIIGKGVGNNRPFKKIIVGTQVIEQSLDIDFDVMISDIAPMDLLIQRIGRLHRHDLKDRPKSLKIPNLYILDTNDDYEYEKGTEAVYGKYILMRTQYFMPKIINIPMDISYLIQKIYSNEELELDENLKSIYENSKQKYNEKIDYKKKRANDYKLKSPVLKQKRLQSSTLVGWLNNTSKDKTDEKAFAQVRDIEQTIEVIALKKMGTGYGIFEDGLDITNQIGNYNIDKEIAKNTLRLPRLLSLPHNIDKTIELLENYYKIHLLKWEKSTWLKGELGIIFDEENKFEINGVTLKYDTKYGVYVLREEIDNGKI